MHPDIANYVVETSQIGFTGIEVHPTKDGTGLKALTQGDLLTALVIAVEEASSLGHDHILDQIKDDAPGMTLSLVNSRWYVLE